MDHVTYEHCAMDGKPERPLGVIVNTHSTYEAAQADLLKSLRYDTTWGKHHPPKERLLVHVVRHKAGECSDCS